MGLSFFLKATLYADPSKLSEEKIRASLIALGFEDYSAQAKDTLENHPEKMLGNVSPLVLKFNEERFQVINHARELAVLFGSELERKGQSRDRIRDFANLTARALSLQPKDPYQELPDEVFNAPPEKREKLAKDILVRWTRNDILEQARALTADFMVTFYGKEAIHTLERKLDNKWNLTDREESMRENVTKIYNHILPLVRFAYLDSTMGQTRYLGRALSAVMLRESRVSQNKDMEEILMQESKKRGLTLENFVGDTWVLPTEKGKIFRSQIENGDFITERGLEGQSADISWAARPAWRDTFHAMRRGLWGTFTSPLLAVHAKPMEKLTSLDKIRMRLSESPLGRQGFSHMGIANVLVDPESGVKMTWIVDNYPNEEYGGIRITGLEQFGPIGPIKAIGITRYDPEKFWDFVQEHIRKEGYNPVAWVSELEPIDKEGKKLKVEKIEKQEVPTLISEEEFRKLHAVPREEAKKWFETIMKRVTEHVRKDYLSESGLGFARGFSNFCGRGYCSFTPNLAARQMVGIDLQQNPDRWSVVLKALKALGVKSAKNLKTDIRIIAPSGFMSQQGLIDPKHTHRIIYPRTALSERVRVTTMPGYLPIDDRAMEATGRILKSVASQIEIDPDTLYAVVDDAVENAHSASKMPFGKNVGTSLFHGRPDVCVQLLRSLE